MELAEKNCKLARILSGEIRCYIKSYLFFVRRPTLQQCYTAEEIYQETYESLKYDTELRSEEEFLDFMFDNELWTMKDQERMASLEEDIEDIKVQLFESSLQSIERQRVRKILDAGRKELNDLSDRRHKFDYLTRTGAAASARYRYILGCSLFFENNLPYWNSDICWDRPDNYLDQILDQVLEKRLIESDFRELSRSEPWLSTWNIREFCGRGLFDKAATELTDEQKALCTWSHAYETIRQHPECPHDTILDDDDMLDGWMIIQRRKREHEQAKKQGEDKLNDKIRNAHEVYLPAESIEDARRIHKMNDPVAAMWWQKRISTLKSKGIVNELDMPDTRQRLNQAILQHFSQQQRN
jgi:hypothetical protein